MTEPRIEAVARAICQNRGLDPDKVEGLDWDYSRDDQGRPREGSDLAPTRHAALWTSKAILAEAGKFVAMLAAAQSKGETS